MKRFFVYGLFDPLEPDVIRYVGAASHEGRPLEHTTEAYQHRMKNTHKLNWIRSLGERGYGWRVLCACASWGETMVAEKAEIAELRAAGIRLTNGTGGGEGFFEPTPEVKAKCAAAIREAFRRPETRARVLAAARARGADPKFRAALRAAWKRGIIRRPWTPEANAKRIERLKQVNARADTTVKRAVGIKASWGIPGARERRCIAMRAASNKPDVRERRRAAIAAGVTAWWKRKKASI